MLANDTVPVGRVFFVEEGFDELSDVFLSLFAVDSLVDLVLDVGLHFQGHVFYLPLHNSLGHFLFLLL